MYKSLYLILACVFVFSYEASVIGRGTFQAKLRHCKWLCAVRDSQQKNTIQTCTVLADHQNVTVSKCVSRCLVKHEEDIKNSTECQCENGKCMGKSATSESTPFSPSDQTRPTDPNSTPSVMPSSSSTSAQTSSSGATSSTASSSAPPSTSSEPTTARRLIENFEYDEDDFPWL